MFVDFESTDGCVISWSLSECENDPRIRSVTTGSSSGESDRVLELFFIKTWETRMAYEAGSGDRVNR